MMPKCLRVYIANPTGTGQHFSRGKGIFFNAAAVKPNCCTGGASVKLSVSDPSMVTITVSATLNRIHQLTNQLNTLKTMEYIYTFFISTYFKRFGPSLES